MGRAAARNTHVGISASPQSFYFSRLSPNTKPRLSHLLLFLALITALFLLLRGLCFLPPNTSGSPTAKRTRQCKIYVLLTVQPHDKAWHIDNLLSDTDVSLLDEDSGMVDGLGKTEFVDAGLQAAFQEIFNLEGKHVIEFHARFVEDTDADEPSDQGIAFEEALGILLVEGEQLTAPLQLALASVKNCTEVFIPSSATDF